MRPKRKNVCQNCRAKKLACDGAQPECSQCVFKQIRCSGYKQEFVFVGNTTVNTNVRTEPAQKKKTTFARSTVVLDTHTLHAKKTQRSASPSDTTGPVLPVEASIVESQSCYDLEDDIQFIMEQFAPADEHTSGEPSLSYNQICGAWINVLPLIAKNRSKDYPLVPAIRALASALRRHSDVDVDGQGCRPRIVEVYCESLRHMGRAIAEARGASSIEHITAIMCLADTDIIAPELKSGWMTHVRAVGDMLERLGPTAFSIGTMHTMFIGFRPLLLLSSILHRHGTFLAREEWITEPFQGQPVSIIQQLLNRACGLPALLERFCEINHISSLPDLVTVNQLEQDFHAVLSRLREWEQTFKSQVSHPLFWSRSDPETWSLPGANALWFPNMMTATSLTHYWAFEIVVRTHISALHQIASTAKGHNSQTHTNVYTEASAEYSLLVLADMICDSTSYLLQPVFKYHGLWSAFFTLPTALRVFRQEQVLSSSRARRSQRIAKLLASRDVYFPENYLVQKIS